MRRTRPRHANRSRKCDNCELRFRSHFCMILHLKVHQRTAQGWFGCATCKKRFQMLTRFVKHRKRHPSRYKWRRQRLKETYKTVKKSKSFKDATPSKCFDDGALKGGDEDVNEQVDQKDAVLLKPKSDKLDEEKETSKKNSSSPAFEFIRQLKDILKLNLDSDEPDVATNGYSLQVSEVTSSGSQFSDNEEQSAVHTSLHDKNVLKTSQLERIPPTSPNCNNGSTISAAATTKSMGTQADNRNDVATQVEGLGGYVDTEKHKTQGKEMPRRLYTCSFCKANFFSYSSLRKHKRASHKIGCKPTALEPKVIDSSKQFEKQRHQCILCLQELCSLKGLNRHMQDVHKCRRNIPKNFKQRLAANGVNLFGQDSVDVAVNCLGSSYFENRNESSLLKCSLCDASFLTYSGLKGHLKTKHSIGINCTAKPAPKNEEVTGVLSEPTNAKEKYDKHTHPSYVDDNFTSYKSKSDGYDSETSTYCKKCDSKFADVRKRRQHSLETHGLEISFEGEKVFFSEWQSTYFSKGTSKFVPGTLADPIIDTKEKYYNIENKSCKLCASKYRSFSSLQKHMTQKHSIKAVRKMHLIRWTKKSNLSSCIPGKRPQLASVNKNASINKAKELKAGGAPNQPKCPTSSCLVENEPVVTNQAQGVLPVQLQMAETFVSKPLNEKSTLTASQLSRNIKVSESHYEKAIQWKADFQRKRYFCYLCDVFLSGYFILRRHMRVCHKIHLDQHGSRIIDPQNKHVDAKKGPLNSPYNAGVHGKGMGSLASNSVKAAMIGKDVESACDEDATMDVNEAAGGKVSNSNCERNSQGRYTCPHCSADFANLIDRHIHISDAHKKLQASPKQCGVSFETGTDRKKEDAKVKCPLPFVDVLSLTKAPAKEGNGEAVCDAKAKSEIAMIKHKNRRGSGAYSCRICGLSYVYTRGLQRHVKDVHSMHTGSSTPLVATGAGLGESTTGDASECSARVIANLQAISATDIKADKTDKHRERRESGGSIDAECFSPVPPCDDESETPADMLEGNIFWQLDATLKQDASGSKDEAKESLFYARNEESGAAGERPEPACSRMHVLKIPKDMKDGILDVVLIGPETHSKPGSQDVEEAETSGSDCTRVGVTSKTCGAEVASKEASQRSRLESGHKKGVVCTIPGCGKLFECRRNYVQHLKNTCKLCHKRFSSEANVGRHLRNVHKISDVLNCDICGEEFPEPISLALHNKEKHLN